MSYLRSLGATAATPTVKDLQRQINRFFVQVPTDGRLDGDTARVAMQLVMDRYQQSYDASPSNETLALLNTWRERAKNPKPYVLSELAQVINIIRDYADFVGRPPPAGAGGLSARTVGLAAAALAVLVIVTRPRSRRRR